MALLLANFPLGASGENFFSLHLGWIIALAICVLGLVGLGGSDLRRFSPVRMQAIAGVCFSESLRRRVLWITPLAMLGVVIVAQLQRPLDDEDAIRQTIKYCLFATGMVVVLTTIILACTNLPKEIDNRVIYTIVTKPTTRLEIMAGKVLGFGWVAAAILIIMGIFTFAYVELRAQSMQSYLQQRLDNLAPGMPGGQATREVMEHYAKQGLVHAASYDEAQSVEIFARPPHPSDKVRWCFGDSEGEILAPFDVSQDLLPIPADRAMAEQVKNDGWVIEATIQREPVGASHDDWKPTPLLHPAAAASTDPAYDIYSWKAIVAPVISVEILGPNKFTVVAARDIQRMDFPPGQTEPKLESGGYAQLPRYDAKDQAVRFWVPPVSLDKIRALLDDPRRIYVTIHGVTREWQYGVARDGIHVYQVHGGIQQLGKSPQTIPQALGSDGQPAWPIFRGRMASNGTQLRGGSDLQRTPVGIYTFRGEEGRLDSPGGNVPFEMRVYVERSGMEARTDVEDQTLVEVRAFNPATGQTSPPVNFHIESNHLAFFSLPAAWLSGGIFDLQLRSLTSGHYLGLRDNTISAVASEHYFGVNLLKSLSILWLMALLVAVVAVFCSTFVSWPIAVVLTLVILLGRWGVEQLGDTGGVGVGRTVVSQFFPDTSPAIDKTISSSVEGLSSGLHILAKVLPDISQFAAIDNIDRGVNIPNEVVLGSFKVILLFGVPLLVLGYIFLKRKEVAP